MFSMSRPRKLALKVRLEVCHLVESDHAIILPVYNVNLKCSGKNVANLESTLDVSGIDAGSSCASSSVDRSIVQLKCTSIGNISGINE